MKDLVLGLFVCVLVALITALGMRVIGEEFKEPTRDLTPQLVELLHKEYVAREKAEEIALKLMIGQQNVFPAPPRSNFPRPNFHKSARGNVYRSPALSLPLDELLQSEHTTDLDVFPDARALQPPRYASPENWRRGIVD